MPAVFQPVEESQSSEPRSAIAKPSSRAFFYYSLTLALVPLLAVVASFLIARSSWYLRHQRNSYLAISDYPFTLKNADCEVIIYGDSSALTGVSPPIIEAATHLRTCNIAQPNTALAIVGTFTLDTYLRNNAPPRFIIFQFTAPDFAPRDAKGRLSEEGALQVTRHKLDVDTLILFARHPLQTLEFSGFILRSALVDRDWTGAAYDQAWAQVRTAHGLFTAPGGPLKSCVGDLEVRIPNTAYITGLRIKYSRRGTRALVYSAPFPECDPSYRYYSDKLAVLADNPLRRFPIQLFNEQNHFTREGADLNSKKIAEDITIAIRTQPQMPAAAQN
jgi:hypothetical protein